MERPWVKSYPPGVNADPESRHLAWSTKSSRRAAQGVAREHQRSISWGGASPIAELDALVNRAAKGFQALGVKPGVHVGLYLPNCPQFAIAYFGALRAGGTIVAYSPLDAAQTLEHKLADSQTEILVTLDLAALYPQIAAVVAHSGVRKLVIGDLAEFSAAPGPIRAQIAAGKADRRSSAGRAQCHLRKPARQRRRLRAAAGARSDARRSPRCNIPAARPASRKARC